MKKKVFTEFKKSEHVFQVKLVSEMLNMAQSAGGSVMFTDELGQIWKLELIERNDK